jgi:hypothetical protein
MVTALVVRANKMESFGLGILRCWPVDSWCAAAAIPAATDALVVKRQIEMRIRTRFGLLTALEPSILLGWHWKDSITWRWGLFVSRHRREHKLGLHLMKAHSDGSKFYVFNTPLFDASFQTQRNMWRGSILDAGCYCPNCDWEGAVDDCEPDVDGNGRNWCPACGEMYDFA